ncbi:hypothetical protein Tco_0499304 [Tanacetum coccineum]
MSSNSPKYLDTANSGGKKETKAMVFHKMDTEEISDRFVAPCFVNGLEAYDGEINLGVEENLISNEFAVKLCLEHEVRSGNKVVKKELIVASFMRLTKGIADFGTQTITIYPELDEFLEISEEEEKIGDDWDILLDDLDFGDIPDIEGIDVPQFVCKMGKSKEERHVAYSEKYKKILDGICLDKMKLDGMNKEEEEAIIKIKGEALIEKEDPGAFVIPIRLEGKINLNALADSSVSYKCLELSKRFSDNIPKKVDEILKRVDDYARSKEAFRNTELPRGEFQRKEGVNQWVPKNDRSQKIIMEYLVKISKKARILELKRRNMKKLTLTSYMSYPSRRYGVFVHALHERPQRNKDQYALIEEVTTKTIAEPILKKYMENAQAESKPAESNIIDDINIKLSKELLMELKNNAYHEMFNEDVVDHIANVIELPYLVKILVMDSHRLRMKVFPLSLADDARQWWINEGEGKITTWEDLVRNSFVNSISNPTMAKKKCWMQEITGGLIHLNSYHDWNKRQMDNSILSNKEWKESDYGNPLNTATDSFFKAHDEHDNEEGNELRQRKSKEDNKNDEQPNKRVCKAKKFEAIKYSL